MRTTLALIMTAGLSAVADARDGLGFVSGGLYHKSMDVSVKDEKLQTNVEGTATLAPNAYVFAYGDGFFTRMEIDVLALSRSADGGGKDGTGGYLLKEDGMLGFLPKLELGMLWVGEAMGGGWGAGAGIDISHSVLLDIHSDGQGKNKPPESFVHDLGFILNTPVFFGELGELQILAAPMVGFGWSFYGGGPGSYGKAELLLSASSKWLGGFYSIGVSNHELPEAGNNNGTLETSAAFTKIGVAIPLAFFL